MKDVNLKLKYKYNFIIYIYMYLLLIFLCDVLISNGLIRMIVFISSSIFMIIVMGKMEEIVYFFFALFPNTELWRASFMGISIQKSILLICLLVVFLKIKKYKFSNIIVPVWFYLIWFVYIEIDQWAINDDGSISGAILILLMMVISVLFQLIATENRKSAQKIIISAFVGFSFIVIIAYVELIIGHTFFYHIWAGSERYRYGIMRAGSTVSDPNNICFFIVPFIFWSNINSVKKIVPRYYRKIIQILSIIIVFLTSSRTGLITLIAGIALCIIARKKLIFLFSIPIIIIVSNSVMNIIDSLMGMDSGSTNFRNYIIKQCLAVWNDHKIFGIGAGKIMSSIGYQQMTQLNTMNTYIYMLVGFGIIGVILFICFWIFMVKKDVYFWIKKKDINVNNVLKIISVLVIMVIAYTLDTFYMMLMWMFPAMLCAVDYLEKEKIKANEQET